MPLSVVSSLAAPRAVRTAQEAEPKGRAAEEIRDLAKWVFKEVGLLTKKQGNKVTKKEAA